jgi:hypothetical protein
MRALIWLTGITLGALAIWESIKSQESSDRPQHEEFEGYTVTRTRMPGNQEMVRFRGSYDDIMRSLGVIEEPKPTLPDGLDIMGLPKYSCGCPHCGTTSMVGENMWRYQELSRTRGPYDNTTTYLTKCKSCKGFMRTTVDHDD